MSKSIAFRQDAREAVRDGVAKLARAAKATFGPRERHVMLDEAFGAPVVTRDGVTVVKAVEQDGPGKRRERVNAPADERRPDRRQAGGTEQQESARRGRAALIVRRTDTQ